MRRLRWRESWSKSGTTGPVWLSTVVAPVTPPGPWLALISTQDTDVLSRTGGADERVLPGVWPAPLADP